MKRSALGWVSAGVLIAAAATLAIPAARDRLRNQIPKSWIVHLNGYRFGYRVDYNARIAMPDGVKLAASVYRPNVSDAKLATVLVRLPYNRLEYGEGLRAAEFFAKNGYVVVLQDIRGKYASEGQFEPYRFGTSDGAATLDWIVAQPWSNGKVGTFGCSALGELQYSLARAQHSAHTAMAPSGAGGAMGSAMGRYAYFGLFEGGIFELATGFGWFVENGAFSPQAPAPGPIDVKSTLRSLPVDGLVQRVRPGPNAYQSFVRTPLTDPWWNGLDYVSAGDVLSTPSLIFNTWGDQTVGDALALAQFARARSGGRLAQHVVIGPGTHCHIEEAGDSGKFGDLKVPGAAQPYMDWTLQWFDHRLRGKGSGLADLPAYLIYMMGEGRWLRASQWPPPEAHPERWYLDSGGRANTSAGDGRISRSPPPRAAVDHFRYDPMNPVPSHGGPVCCTGTPADRAGPLDQRTVESRPDVLVYTSDPRDTPLRVAGPLRATLTVSSSARDTDFIARLVDVFPDGRAIGIQEGALRVRYRNGIDNPTRLEPDQPVQLRIDMRAIGYTFAKGHRLRLDITSSSFPRLERNLNTGGNNFDEVVGVPAINGVHHGADAISFLELLVLPAHE